MITDYETYIRHYFRKGNTLTVWIRPQTPRSVRNEMANLLERVSSQVPRSMPLTVFITDDPLPEPVQMCFFFMDEVVNGYGR
jgi:hypothetical protein